MSDRSPSNPDAGVPPLLRTIGLTKRYGNFLANDAIDIDVWPQQIHDRAALSRDRDRAGVDLARENRRFDRSGGTGNGVRAGSIGSNLRAPGARGGAPRRGREIRPSV